MPVQDSFGRTTLNISVQPNDDDVPYGFPYEAAATIDGDGSIPFNQTISSVDVTAHTSAGAVVTGDLINSFAVGSNQIVSVFLKWPGTAGPYHLTMVVTYSGGGIKEFDFNRVIAEDV